MFQMELKNKSNNNKNQQLVQLASDFCCGFVRQRVVDLLLAFALLWICRTACCIACCTANPQQVEASGVRHYSSGAWTTDRADREAPRLVADRPRLEADRSLQAVDAMNAVRADISDVQTTVTTTRRQVRGIT